jgi:hypothetical protein
MRTGYAVTKVVTFCGLALAQAFSGFGPDTGLPQEVPWMMRVLQFTAWVALVFCVFRGLPVIISSLRRFWGTPAAVTSSAV